MQTDAITIRVDSALARAYRAASEQDRRRMDLLVGMQLTEFLRSSETLEAVMDEMSREAQQAGLTPEIMDAILHG